MDFKQNSVGPHSEKDWGKHKCHDLNDLGTRRGQKCQMVKIVALVIVPIFILIMESSFTMSEDGVNYNKQTAIKDIISLCIDVGTLIHYLQIERGTSTFFVSTGGEQSIMANLEKTRTDTDSVLNSMNGWVSLQSPNYFRSKQLYMDHLQQYRVLLNPQNMTLRNPIEFYSEDNEHIIEWVGRAVRGAESETIWQELTAYYLLLISKEQAGVERALGSTFFATGM